VAEWLIATENEFPRQTLVARLHRMNCVGCCSASRGERPSSLGCTAGGDRMFVVLSRFRCPVLVSPSSGPLFPRDVSHWNLGWSSFVVVCPHPPTPSHRLKGCAALSTGAAPLVSWGISTWPDVGRRLEPVRGCAPPGGPSAVCSGVFHCCGPRFTGVV